MKKYKLKKDDLVIVISGKHKGKQGKVKSVIKSKDRIIIDGVGMVTKHKKPTQFDKGGRITEEGSIHISNVAYLDSKENKATKIGYKFDENYIHYIRRRYLRICKRNLLIRMLCKFQNFRRLL